MKDSIKNRNFYLVKKFVPYYYKYKGVLALDLLCASLTTICDMILPIIVRYITNAGSPGGIGLTVNAVLIVGGIYLILRLIDTAANYYMASVGHIMGAKIETDMRKDLYSHLQRLSHSYYDNAKVGQVMARITSDLFEVTEFSHHCPEEYFIAVLKIVVSFIVLANINLTLTLVIFAIFPIMLLSSMYFNKKMRAAFSKSRFQIGEINSQVEDSLLGIRVIKSFANEHIEEEKFAKGNHDFLDIKYEMYKYMAGFQSVVRFYDGVMYIAVVVVGALFIINGKIQSGDLIAYLLYVTALLQSVRRIIEFTEQFQRGMTGIERFYEIMDEPIEIEDTLDAKELKDIKGEVIFKSVSFRYEETDEEVLKDINLIVNAGENVAIVGPSGSGKTTMCSLIPRFYDVSEGVITLDGTDVKNIKIDSLRKKIGVVQQDVYLFSGTVYDNIIYGRPEATMEEVKLAAKQAGAEEFIDSLPKGYKTYVGEHGTKLSGGQKQRISIARVFLKNPPILILDEATSALDNESEGIVQKYLEDLTVGRTTFTIAHRLSTIKNAQRILVLTGEGIVEQGTHHELMEKKGVYYNLYNMSKVQL